MIKVNLALCLTKHHIMKMYGGVKVYSYYCLMFDTRQSEWPVSPLFMVSPVQIGYKAGWIPQPV